MSKLIKRVHTKGVVQVAWYYRRSKKIGPFRVTMSNSGVSTSVGVGGLRLTKSHRGTYFSASPGGGLYYRQRIDKPCGNSVFREFGGEQSTPVEEIVSNPVEQIVGHHSVVERINQNERRGRWIPFVGGGLLLVGLSSGSGIGLLFGIACLILAFGCRAYLRSVNTVQIEYNLDENGQRLHSTLSESFTLLERCHRVWQVRTFNNTSDWKRNGGANQLLDRSIIHSSRRSASSFRCNCEVFSIALAAEVLYFLPDMILIHQRGRYGSVAYSDLDIRSSETRFREAEGVPADSQIVDMTWQYVNRSGMPDRRFTNNKQIPVTLYGELAINSEPGLRFVLLTSSPAAAHSVGSALELLKMHQKMPTD